MTDTLEQLLHFHYTGGPNNGYDVVGYIGNSDRNYITDTWVQYGSELLRWTPEQLSAWMCSVWGRLTLEHKPVSYNQMVTAMRQCNIEQLVDEEFSEPVE